MLFAAPCRLCDAILTGASRVPVCDACLGRVRPLELLAWCDRCQLPLSLAAVPTEGVALCGPCRQDEPAFERLRSFGAYDAELRQLIVLLKYNRVHTLARLLGGWLATVVEQDPALAEVDTIVPVPLYPARQRARGYNQAELLARELSRWLKKPVAPHALARIKDTPSQTGLTPLQRIENVRGAFTCPEPTAAGRRAASAKLDLGRILLVDDVCTTGATLNACARALERAGAQQVVAATVARVLQEI